jgi:hypothetical protein
MDFISAFKSELFRPLVTLLIPGGVATAPYFVLVGHLIPQIRNFWNDHPSTAVAIGIAVITGTGLVLENFGSRLENVWDFLLDKEIPGHKLIWERYLKLRIQDEIVGQRYLRSLLVRMKFELAMAPACIAGGFGGVWLNQITTFWTHGAYALTFAPLVFAIYFTYESYQSAKLMGETRKWIVQAASSEATCP